MKFPKFKKKLKKNKSERNCFKCKHSFSYGKKKMRCPYPDKMFSISDCDKFEFFSTYKSI